MLRVHDMAVCGDHLSPLAVMEGSIKIQMLYTFSVAATAGLL